MIKKFIVDNLYSKDGGIKPATLFTGGLAAALSFISLPLGGMVLAGGLLLSPLINKALRYIGLTPAPVPGGIAKVPDIPVGEGKAATIHKNAPVRTHLAGYSDGSIRSPLLENMTVPKADIASTVDARMRGIDESIKLANLPAGSAPGLKERVDALWENTTRQEKQISDYVATMANYQQDQQAYSAKGGERDKLISTIQTQLGISKEDAQALVPTLPEIPKTERTRRGSTEQIDNPLFSKSYDPLPSYSALYEQERKDGNLQSRYEGKPWNKLDVIVRQGYIVNKLNSEIVQAKSSLDVSKLNPDGGGLPAPDFKHCSKSYPHGIQWLCGDGSQWTRKNAAAVVITLLARNTNDLIPEWGRTGTSNGGVIDTYANAAIKRSAAHPETVKEYKKVQHYVELVKSRQWMIASIRRMNDPVDSLINFRNTEIIRSHTQAENFLNSTLPAVNALIEAKAQYNAQNISISSMTPDNKDKDTLQLVFKDNSHAEPKEYKIIGSYAADGKFIVTTLASKGATSEWKDEPIKTGTTIDLANPDTLRKFTTPNAAEQSPQKAPATSLKSIATSTLGLPVEEATEGSLLTSNAPSTPSDEPKIIH